MNTTILQAPIRNSSIIGASVYSHSGEFAPTYTDLSISGRGLNFHFGRSYRSSQAGQINEVGRGWTASITKRIARNRDSIIYHNGSGEVYEFTRMKRGGYTAPAGLYAILTEDNRHLYLKMRYGQMYDFESPEEGGRITRMVDSNQNAILFSYSSDSTRILDTMRREIMLTILDGQIRELRDHAGRSWRYNYDQNGCLIEVTQPATRYFPNGTSIRYEYSDGYNLTAVIDAKAQRYLVNHYDELGRVKKQEHGSGVFQMEYEEIGQSETGSPIYRTHCVRKNGSRLILEHNESGNVLSRTVSVRKESFPAEDVAGVGGDVVDLVTRSTYNENFECTSRVLPAGNRSEWIYSKKETSLLNRGNLLQVNQFPATGVESDQTQLVRKYVYEPVFQRVTRVTDSRGHETVYEYDEKGNLISARYPSVTIQPVNGEGTRPAPLIRSQQETYHYNTRGQLLERKHIDGAISRFFYYPVDDPTGLGGTATATSDPNAICGYLARDVRDAEGAQLTREFAYDVYGNTSIFYDGKSNSVRLSYNAMGMLEQIIGREPYQYSIEYKYDANYNEIESAQTFQRFPDEESSRTGQSITSTLREQKEYNALDHLIRRTIVSEEKSITEFFVRDADEQVIRQIQPLGNSTEYIYDERSLLIERRFGVGAEECYSDFFSYTMNGDVRTYIDGNGGRTAHHYDGFQRYLGFRNSVGTTKAQWLDEAGNVIRVLINEDVSEDQHGLRSDTPAGKFLMEIKYDYDEWNRIFHIDRVWLDLATGRKLGQSRWSGEPGHVSTVLEYGENGRLGRLWSESGNIIEIHYDGARRVVKASDSIGEESSFAYDENSNLTSMEYLGPAVEGRRARRVLRRSYDGMDRVDWQQVNDEAPEHFAYNSFGRLLKYTAPSGIEISYLTDPLGRGAGHAYAIRDAANPDTGQSIVRHLTYDDNYRLVSWTDAVANSTSYRYDALNRLVETLFADGTVSLWEYDANRNIVGVVDQNKNEVRNRYDASNRLIERRSLTAGGEGELFEQFAYDGLNRLIASQSPDAKIRRRFDSLSRLVEEKQGKHTVRFAYDSAGNLTQLEYPGGEKVVKTYDLQNRVRLVQNAEGETVASIDYRANHQVAKMRLGSSIEASLNYNDQDRLESIEYHEVESQRPIEGFRYLYDAAGRITHKIQLSEGQSHGERYFYDDANRPKKAQYGVQDVFDPDSPFEQQTSYEYFPEGPWKRRIDIDGQGNILDDRTGTIDTLNNYQSFGAVLFAYDANRNCIRKGTPNPGWCLYTYDALDRLVKAVCYDELVIAQTIEYFYDALGRLVRKVVTDKDGNVTVYTYVWAGNTLLEEYENSMLARTYVYSFSSVPLQLSLKQDRSNSYYYVLDGRGLASGLLSKQDPNAFAEKYGYEVTGASYMKEVDGIKVEFPSRSSKASSLLNSVLVSTSSGTPLRDWVSDVMSLLGGKHLDPTLGAVLNLISQNGKTHKGVADAILKQMNEFADLMGMGVGWKPPSGPEVGGMGKGISVSSVDSKTGGAEKSASDARNIAGSGMGGGWGPLGQNWAWYADGTDPDDSMPSEPSMSTPSTDTPGRDPKYGIAAGNKQEDKAGGNSNTSSSDAPTQTNLTPSNTGSSSTSSGNAGTDIKPSGSAPSGSGKATDGYPYSGSLGKDYAFVVNAPKGVNTPVGTVGAGGLPYKAGNETGARVTLTIAFKYVDPDLEASTKVSKPTLEEFKEIEAWLNRLYRPVDPYTGIDAYDINASAIPTTATGGLDPTLILTTGDPDDPGVDLGSVDILKISGGGLKHFVNPLDHPPERPEPPIPGGDSWTNS